MKLQSTLPLALALTDVLPPPRLTSSSTSENEAMLSMTQVREILSSSWSSELYNLRPAICKLRRAGNDNREDHGFAIRLSNGHDGTRAEFDRVLFHRAFATQLMS